MVFKKILILLLMKKIMDKEKLLSDEENRYVSFPIQHVSFGKCIKALKPIFGQLKN